MKKFNALIITGKHLRRAAAITAVSAVLILTAVLLIRGREIQSVAVFSPQETPSDDSYSDILEQGLPSQEEKHSIKNVISALLGFDTDKPETIIQSSSAVFESETSEQAPANDQAPQPETTPEPQPTDEPSDDKELPDHKAIAVASGLKINNATNYDVDVDAMCAEDLSIELTLDAPEVLIVHTHTTECYNGDEMTGESERTTNPEQNMCRIGDIIAETLNSYGIQTVHDKTIHDYPTYQGAYTRALETIEKNMEQYPSIKVVLDVHRDAYIYNDGSKLRVSAEVNGKDSAQVMLVLGTDSMGLYHPYWKENLKLAAKVQNAAEIMYPGIMRPINLRRERFNMHVTKGSLLLEMGSNGNSLEEAEAAAGYIGKALAAALLNG